MATNNELADLYRNAIGFVDPNLPTTAETDAHALLDRIEVHLWKIARSGMEQDDTEGDLRNLKLANRITIDSAALARRVLVLLLGSTAAANASMAVIVGFDDAAVANGVGSSVIARFAHSLAQPGAR